MAAPLFLVSLRNDQQPLRIPGTWGRLLLPHRLVTRNYVRVTVSLSLNPPNVSEYEGKKDLSTGFREISDGARERQEARDVLATSADSRLTIGKFQDPKPVELLEVRRHGEPA